MKIAAGIVVLIATLGVVKLWSSSATSGWTFAGVMVGAGLSVILVAWIAEVWRRNRQRTRLLEMRGSALW
jgi:hypothetical protein